MTNRERWNLLMRDITSPQSYIDFGFTYIIAASLQRRVWCGPSHMPIFPNQYPILVGPPGLGKGLVIKQVEHILKYHPLQNPNAPKVANNGDAAKITYVDPHVTEAINAANYAQATNGETHKSNKIPLLIPVAANATTFEALTRALARSTRRINYMKYDNKLGKDILQIYTHCSLAFCLEEISSLFRKHQESVVNFIITAYDCGDYESDTKTAGNDDIKRCCLNFFGGTTPTFMETTFNDKLLNDGFASRCWFIVEQKNRFDRITFPELSPEQEQARDDLIAHVLNLSKLYGKVEYEDDAWAYIKSWWEDDPDGRRASYVNKSPKLEYYYSRKNIHLQKLAMAGHFAEDGRMNEKGAPAGKITLAIVKWAMGQLNAIEANMHLALNTEGTNPLGPVARKIASYVRRNGPQTTVELLTEFWSDVDKDQLDKTLHYMVDTKKMQFDTTTQKWNVI